MTAVVASSSATIDWTQVLIAIVASVPATISAIGVIFVRRDLRTPSGTTIGKQVEDTNHNSRVAATQSLHIAGQVGARIVDHRKADE